MKKRICFNIYDVNAKGGEERMCTILANSLALAGYDVSICSFRSHSNVSSFFPIDTQVRVCHMLGSFAKRQIQRLFPFCNYAANQYKAFLKNHKIDVIIDVDTDRTPFTAPVAKELGIKHIAWDHFCYGRFKQRSISKEIYPHLLQDVDKLVVLTKDDAYAYCHDAKIPRVKITQIYNSSPIQENVQHEHHSYTVLAMGRLTYQKGFDILLEAWHLIAGDFPDWTLKIVGEGEDRDKLQEQLVRLDLKNVQLAPATVNPREEYLHADIFVLSSRYEGLGLVLLEAANMSLPLVAFDCDNGPREIVQDGVNGFLVKQHDIPMLADRIRTLITDPDLRRKMSNNALGSVTKFRTEYILDQWIQLIEKL